MKKLSVFLTFLFLLSNLPAISQSGKTIELKSPDGKVSVKVEAGGDLRWSVKYNGESIIEPSVVALELQDGSVLGANAKATSSPVKKVNSSFKTINYRKSEVADVY